MLIIYGMVTWGNIMNIEEDEDALVINCMLNNGTGKQDTLVKIMY